jgi:hypothetical protein
MDASAGFGIRAQDDSAVRQLKEVVLAAGAGQFHFDLRLPANYRINPTAPFEISADGDLEAVTVTGGAFHLRTGDPSFPIAIPLQTRPGKGWLDIRIMVYYCELPGERLCFYQSARLRAPVTVPEEGGPPEARAVFQMELPAAPI